MKFLHPERLWFLLGIVAMIGMYVLAQTRRKQRAVKFTNVDLLDSILPKRAGWRRPVVSALTLVGLGVGIFALAQPYREERPRENRSIIMVVLDVSLSMQADDVPPSRFEAAKEQAKSFIGQVDPSIEVGLVSFSKSVRLRVPPTLNRTEVIDGVDRLQLGEGTAIGDAIIATTDIIVGEFRDSAPSANDESTTDENAPADNDPLGNGAPPAAIVILTDGETVPGLTPGPVGAQAAAAVGLPVYGIAFGTPDGTITYDDPNEGPIQEPVPVAYDELTEAADLTGGKFYAAETAGDLANVYTDIETQLEPALKQPAPIRVELTVRFLAIALALLALSVILGQWWLGGIA